MNILVTGGTGSFGHEFVRYTLNNYKPKRLVVFSRDEMKQWEMAKNFSGYKCLRFFIGDVREKERLYRALANIDYVVHAAATKIVPTAEYNPFECVKTNIIGAMNVIDAAIDRKVKKVVALSTDKASSPINLYGATKLASDKLFTASNAYTGEHGTQFAVVRYGNVVSSRGSVIPLFKEQRKKGVLTITNFEMTRFILSLDDAVNLVSFAFENASQGDLFVQKSPACTIIDLAEAMLDLFNAKKNDNRLPSYEIESSFIKSSKFSILDALEKLNLSNSRSDTKRLIKSKGIRINEEIYNSSDLSLKIYANNAELKIIVGKKNIGILKIKK